MMPEFLDHPAWTTAAATAVSYALVLVVLSVLLFVVPLLVVTAFP